MSEHPRWEVGGYGSHSWEIIDSANEYLSLIVGNAEQTHADNRFAGEDVPEPRVETLRWAERVAEILNREMP